MSEICYKHIIQQKTLPDSWSSIYDWIEHTFSATHFNFEGVMKHVFPIEFFLTWNTKEDMLRHSSKHLILCSTDEIKSYRFEMTW